MKNALLKLFTGSRVEDDERHTMDHVVPTPRPVKDPAKSPARRHAEALIEAARRHGKPFKCGPAVAHREVIVDTVPQPGIDVPQPIYATLLPQQRGHASAPFALWLAILVYSLQYAPVMAAFAAEHADSGITVANCLLGLVMAFTGTVALYRWLHSPRRES